MEAVLEFPFTAEMPVASEPDLSKLPRNERVARQVEAMRAMMDKRGALVPLPLVAELLGVSKQRVHDIIAQGHLEKISIHGHRYVPEDSLVAYVNTERRNGRPPKLPKSATELAKIAIRAAKEI